MAFDAALPILDLVPIAQNLLAYFEANQDEALALAQTVYGYHIGPSAAPLKPFQEFSNSVANRDKPVFPAISFRDDNASVDYSQEVLAGGYSVTFEMMVTNPDPSEAVIQSRIYQKAVKMMIRNIDDASLIANTGAAANKNFLDSIETTTEAIRANATQTDFLQTVTITARFGLLGAGF